MPGDYDESKHPRDHGKWTSSGAAKTSGVMEESKDGNHQHVVIKHNDPKTGKSVDYHYIQSKGNKGDDLKSRGYQQGFVGVGSAGKSAAQSYLDEKNASHDAKQARAPKSKLQKWAGSYKG